MPMNLVRLIAEYEDTRIQYLHVPHSHRPQVSYSFMKYVFLHISLITVYGY
jgi:hypothetical protein